MGTSSCFHVTQVEEIKRIVGEAMYENEVVGPNGSPVSGGGGAAVAVVSQYDKVLLMATAARQFNAVAGVGQNAADAQYVGAITPAEVYGTEAGLLSVGQATSKALAIHNTAVEWDLSLGQSLLVQMRAKTVGVTTSSNVLIGNSDGAAIEGFGFTVYGPAHATLPGRCTFNFKANGTAGQSIQMQPIDLTASATNQYAIPTDALVNYTIFVDGRDRRCYVWVNGEQAGSNWAAVLNAGSTLPAARRNLGLGHVPTDNTYTSTVARATRFRTVRVAVFPSGVIPKSVASLDRAFNANPDIVFTDADYLGA